MLSCKDVQDILVEKEELSLGKKLQFKFHHFICKNCQKIKKQYQVINARLQDIEPQLDDNDKRQINDIISSVREKK